MQGVPWKCRRGFAELLSWPRIADGRWPTIMAAGRRGVAAGQRGVAAGRSGVAAGREAVAAGQNVAAALAPELWRQGCRDILTGGHGRPSRK